MFLRMPITKSTENYSMQIERLKKEIASADCILLGAGAGLSAAAGFDYGGERLKKYFADFERKYGFHDMYSGGFYPYETPEEYWAYWSKYIYVNRYTDAPKPVYGDLFNLVREKEYFVLTTNVDHCFQKSGFDKKRLFYTQGDYGLFQCSVPCHSKTYENETAIREMLTQQADFKIPTSLIPRCPVCGAPMTVNLRCDNTFVQDGGWHAAAQRYEAFLRTRKNQKILFLELGVGYNTPVIIKYPFWQMTTENPNAVYASINAAEAYCPSNIERQSVLINGDIQKVLKDCLLSV